MSMLMLIAVSGALVATPSMSPAGPFGTAVDDVRLAEVVGTGGGTTRLSVFVQEQGTAQGQFAGEDLRASLSTWFADANVQTFANRALILG